MRAFISLRRRTGADQHYRRTAEDAGTRAVLGTWLILGGAAVVVVLLVVVQSQRIRARAFRRATHQATHDALVRSTVELGRNLGLQVIAEGVEDSATWTELDGIGCDVIQGYYVSKPVASSGFDEWLDRQKAPASAVPDEDR